jgi:hypothetical protein
MDHNRQVHILPRSHHHPGHLMDQRATPAMAAHMQDQRATPVMATHLQDQRATPAMTAHLVDQRATPAMASHLVDQRSTPAMAALMTSEGRGLHQHQHLDGQPGPPPGHHLADQELQQLQEHEQAVNMARQEHDKVRFVRCRSIAFRHKEY